MMLANPDGHPFGFVHSVTPIAGARTLLPYLPTVTTEQVYAQLWQVGAAIAIGFTSGRDRLGAEPPLEDEPPPTSAELVARAAEHRDPHVVKFTEASLREHTIRPDPVYLHAAHYVVSHTPRW